MADQYDNTNKGVLFKNDNAGEKRPDYKGTINIDGVEKDLAAWVRVSKKDGSKFMSVSVSEKWVNPKSATNDLQTQAPDFPDDGIPF